MHHSYVAAMYNRSDAEIVKSWLRIKGDGQGGGALGRPSKLSKA